MVIFNLGNASRRHILLQYVGHWSGELYPSCTITAYQQDKVIKRFLSNNNISTRIQSDILPGRLDAGFLYTLILNFPPSSP